MTSRNGPRGIVQRDLTIEELARVAGPGKIGQEGFTWKILEKKAGLDGLGAYFSGKRLGWMAWVLQKSMSAEACPENHIQKGMSTNVCSEKYVQKSMSTNVHPEKHVQKGLFSQARPDMHV